MRILHSYIIILAASIMMLQGCATKQAAEVVAEAPTAEYSIAEDDIAIKMDETVTFKAEVTSNVDFTCAWYLDGTKIAGTEGVTYLFADKGDFVVSFKAENKAGKVERSYNVNVTGEALVVDFTNKDKEINCVIGDEVKISVSVTSGDKSTVHSWKIGDAVVSTSTDLAYTFNTPGTYTLSYYGENADGESASASWTVKVADLPLDVEFSVTPGVIDTDNASTVNITATAKAGLTGFAQTWYADDAEAGTTAAFSKKFTDVGTHTIKYVATNASGDRLERTWTVNVSAHIAQSLLFDNFESAALGVYSYYVGNNVSNVSIMQVEENPCKSETNPSDKVLCDKGSMMTWSSSGYFKFRIDTKPDGSSIPSDERYKYTKVRVKVYVGTTGFTPLLQEDSKSTRSTPCEINGVAFNPASPTLAAWNAAIKTDDWNVFVYDLTGSKYSTEVNNLAQTVQLQFRVFVDFNNNGKAGKDVYFDDIEFIE